MFDIMSRVQKHYDCAVNHYSEDAVLGTFLYGTQNYDCHIETSDVDTKTILVPDIYHLAIAPYKITDLHIDKEICSCFSIMQLVSNWKKQSPNNLEILFTPYFIINPLYEAYWNEFKSTFRERIARYDIKAGVKTVTHQALNTLGREDWDGKTLGNALRLQYYIEFLINKKEYSYKDCLIPISFTDEIKELKEGKKPSANVRIELLSYFESMLKKEKTLPFEKDTALDKIFDNFIIDLIEQRLFLINDIDITNK